MMPKNLISDKIERLANEAGIDVLGFAEADEFTGYTGNQPMRRDPRLSMPRAKTIVVAGVYIGGLTLPVWDNPMYGRTSRLYISGFFLDVVNPLKPLARLLKKEGYQAKICDGSKADGSILPLKLAAVRAGLGWQGKHSLLISKRYGTFLALGGIITDASFKPNHKEEPNRCRNCEKCIKACPLGALEQPYVLNRAKCMSNLLAAEKLPESVCAVMENRIGDCEICQDACPWNKKHLDNPLPTRATTLFKKKIGQWEKRFHLPSLAALSQTAYDEQFGGLNTDYPYAVFSRNVLAAMKKAQTNH